MMVMNDDDWEDKDINNHKRWGFNDKEKWITRHYQGSKIQIDKLACGYGSTKAPSNIYIKNKEKVNG